MTSNSERPEPNRTNLRLMVALIVMLLIGIATRWGYIKQEFSKSFGRMFSTEQVDSTARK